MRDQSVRLGLLEVIGVVGELRQPVALWREHAKQSGERELDVIQSAAHRLLALLEVVEDRDSTTT